MKINWVDFIQNYNENFYGLKNCELYTIYTSILDFFYNVYFYIEDEFSILINKLKFNYKIYEYYNR